VRHVEQRTATLADDRDRSEQALELWFGQTGQQLASMFGSIISRSTALPPDQPGGAHPI
jgi:hypothetical protein